MITGERFWPKVDRDGPIPEHQPSLGPCWIWTASRNPAGYGETRYRQRHYLAHRFAYLLVVGPIPPGRVLDHLCRVPLCVNPAHLEVVTLQENVRRGLKGALCTHCPQGHPLDAANTGYQGPTKTHRYCRACHAARQRAYKRSRRLAARLERLGVEV